MKVAQVMITPDMAQDMLESNTSNRPIKRNHLSFLVREIEAGRWKKNGDPIRIGNDGSLVDGQHRLLAVVQSGIPIATLLITDLDPDVFDTIDSGACRSHGDTLSVAGEKNGRNLAAALIVADELLAGKTEFTRTKKTSNAEILGMMDKHSEIKQSMYWGKPIGKYAPFSISVALHYLFHKANPAKADAFFEAIHTGLGLEFDSPVYLLRQRLIDNATAKGKMTRRYMVALFIKAWNAYSCSRKLKNLRFRETGDAPESFPCLQM
jgi:hypothetical protein